MTHPGQVPRPYPGTTRADSARTTSASASSSPKAKADPSTDQKRPLLPQIAGSAIQRTVPVRSLARALVLAPVVVGLAAIAGLVFLYLDRSSLGQIQSCSMTYMYPNYYQVPLIQLLPPEIRKQVQHSSQLHRYQLWRYVEGPYPIAPRWDWTGDNPNAKETKVIPVLFVHGNAGSPRQVRSIASHTSKLVVRVTDTLNATLRFYAGTNGAFLPNK
ncbi:hypothetical protein BCR44DRAFT_185897 [Catenaria anguillulae PL171]|uniref:GPI inositol-deacylase PGAP1-like alpha/beta domain-containing protein n=1 Tax=Catenaria anguillulae PL171 TaxID=765915 RepID=A0A1Y2HA48_9FUNG|nr:hypothetical protein BCR44DRAFT_185897 [Catenaria anguillulae PL171]